MLKKILFLLTLSLVTLSLVTFAKAAITNSSRVIPYQGRLTDSSGNNVADGTYAMTFKIYTVSSGGSAAFTESFSAGNAVSVSSGLFSVLLGSLSANGVNLDFANPPYYLGITIAANSEMTPRIQLGFAPLAHNSQYLDGTPLSSFQLNTGVLTGAAGTNTRLQATGTGTGSTGNGSIYFLNSSGTTMGRFDTASAAPTGGTITTSGQYTIHTFTASGTFTPNGVGTVEVLVVGGGGSGGKGTNAGGGGGGGGVVYHPSFSVSGPITVTVGDGGVSQSSGSGNNGGDSVFSTLTAKGGAGGGYQNVAGSNGGSGGGGGHQAGGGSSNQGSFTGATVYGYSGGSGYQNSAEAGGGGGGAGGTGGNASGSAGSLTGGSGGAGMSSSISGSATYYAAGGGGSGDPYVGTGGSSIGGNGYSSAVPTPTAGATNTGSGGGGGRSTSSGAGGSGIVIVRYTTTNNYGTLYTGATNTSAADLAEYYVSGDNSMSPGDVVSIAPDNNSKGVLLKSNKPYDSKLVGVISTNPGVVLGSIDGDTGKSDKRQLALAGRVPVKIDPDSDPIDVGDFLTSSDKPGFAKKATESGYVIGKALEKWSGQSTIEVFINLIYKQEKSEIEILKDDVRTLKEEVLKLKNK